MIEDLKAWTVAQADSSDWKAQLRELHAFSERWRQSGHVSEKLYTELQPLWKAAMQSAHARLEAAQHESMARRHALIDEAGVDVIHGHSSHHPKAIEVHHDRLILYGCGDFINDYEGIEGHEEFRGELGLMYFPVLARGSGRLVELIMTPTRLQRFRVNLAGEADRRWLQERLHRECRRFGDGVAMRADGRFSLRWQ